MSEKPHQAKFTQAEIDLLWAVIEKVPKEQINACVAGSVEAVAQDLGIRKTAAEKRWSRLAIRVRKGKGAAEKGVVAAGIAEGTENEASGEDQEIIKKDIGGKHVGGKDVGGKDVKALRVTPKRNHKSLVKNKVSKDKVVKKKTVTKGKRGNKRTKDEVTAETKIKVEESDEGFDDDEAAF
ncbi:hypothetical protein BELL_0168g00210 [Botrytis elliptica]|uniref:Myb-like DNA-binding domain-containing protein n=1 Tax=Botrytis elliptica TaxID=278938 RepID=A0A4Z1JX33_9HELO|nr:hypothetical protein EAE99_009503 [Botrytis elliptica]TGO76220.1 hypothetical protein BELL_0168g00210 [Botrytis elliptica]